MTAIPAILMLSACGGSGGSGEMTSGPLSPQQVGTLIDELGRDITDNVDASNLTTPTELASSGRASYEGFIVVGQTSNPVNDPFSGVGTVTLNVDINENTVSGTATNFYDGAETPMLGSIPLVGGTIVPGNVGSDAASIVELSFESTEDNALDRNGQDFGWGKIEMDGSFFGDTAEHISMNGERDFLVNGGSGQFTAVIGALAQP